MGPKIVSWEGKYNTFSVRLLPIGGFVSMVGEYSDEIAEKKISTRLRWIGFRYGAE
jgi:membrane-associated protease RseP (regulator of RpoE activity)